MYHPPFHRRVLPWIYVAIFFALAPVLIFYTSGYRYNPNKTDIEHHGTLILDSVPRRAAVFLDHQALDEETPITLKNITPGTHHVQLTRAGFHPWEKSLDMRAEYVTFVNRIRLWKEATPTLMQRGEVSTLSADANGATLQLMTAGTGTRLLINGTPTSYTLPAPPQEITQIQWATNGTSFALQTRAQRTWWASTQGAAPVELPQGTYYWAENKLFGTAGRGSVIFDPRQEGYTREPLPPQAIAVDHTWFLEQATTTDRLMLVSYDAVRRAFSLPEGAWMIADRRGAFLLLQDQDRWLAINTVTEPVFGGDIHGQMLRWLPRAETPTTLVVNGTELWLWELGKNPALLARLSQPIVDVAWHRSGDAVVIATATQVFALELDDRGGRQQTPLATFDQIRGIALQTSSLLIAGKKDGTDGLWQLAVE